MLHYVLAPASTLPPFPAAWGAPPQIGGFGDAAFSVLYSDVGPTYYSRATKGANEPGWVSVNLGKLAFPAEGTVADTDRWKWLDMEEAHALEATASRQICRDLPLTGDKTKTRVAILPDK